MRKMLGWLPCRIRCRHDSSRSATPFTTRASRPGFKIKHALALRWMRHVPGSLPPKRRPSQSHARLPARSRSARNQAHRRGRSFQPAVCQRRTRKGALRRSRPSHAFQPCNRPLPAGCIECTENGGARNDRSNQQGTGECR